jgi:hypothetical protein
LSDMAADSAGRCPPAVALLPTCCYVLWLLLHGGVLLALVCRRRVLS